MRPSTILGIACSGLPSLRVRFSSVARSVGHHVGRDVVAGEVLRLGEAGVDGDVVGQFGGAAGQLDEHGVDAAAALHVQVGVEHVPGRRLEAHDLAELDVLLQR